MCKCVFVNVTCPTGPGCDLDFHLLSLRLESPVAIRSEPTARQMSAVTAANTDSLYVDSFTFSYAHFISYAQIYKQVYSVYIDIQSHQNTNRYL